MTRYTRMNGNGVGVVRADVGEKLFEIAGCGRRPTDLHLRLEHLFQTVTCCFASQEIPAIQLAKRVFHILPEPNIVVDIVFHKLLHVCGSVAGVIGGNAVELRLKFRCKVYFHELSVGN